MGLLVANSVLLPPARRLRSRPRLPGLLFLCVLLLPCALARLVHTAVHDASMPASYTTGVLNGSRSVTPDTALRIAKFFGGNQDVAKFWPNLQQGYDLRCAELEAECQGRLGTIEPVRALAR